MRWLTVFMMMLAAACFAQNATPQPAAAQQGTPVFKTGTELVTVPVVVTHGKEHVQQLTKDKFTILEDGVPKPIAFFEEVKAQPEVLRRPTLPAGTYTNVVNGEDHATSLTIIVLDQVNTPMLHQAKAREDVIDFLSRSAARREPTMLVSFGRDGVKVIHDFTVSPDVLISAIRYVKSNMQGSHQTTEDKGFQSELTNTGGVGRASTGTEIDVRNETSDLQQFVSGDPKDLMMAGPAANEAQRRAELTLDSFQQLVRALGGIKGRKSLLWLSNGTVCEPGVSLGGMHTELVDKCNETWRLLSASNISVYPIQVSPSENPGYTGVGKQTSGVTPPSGLQSELIAESFAKYTGGKVCGYRNDDSCLREAVDDSSQYYVLSYYTTPTPKPRWRKIAVKVNLPVQVRARNGYMTAGSEVSLPERRKQDVALSIVSPIDYTGLPMTVQWLKGASENGKEKFGFLVHVNAGALNIDEGDRNHMAVSVVAYAMNQKGDRIGDVTRDLEAHLQEKNLQQVKTSGFSYKDVLEVSGTPGVVKFIVRDNLSGRMGTVTAPLPRMEMPSAPSAQKQ